MTGRSARVEEVRAYYRTLLPFYELEHRADRDLDFWKQICAEYRPERVLEIGAGTGRVTSTIQAFAPVTGIDLSQEMLHFASRRLRGTCASLVVADMCCFLLNTTFSLIVAPSDPFSHLTRTRDRDRALRNIRRHLSSTGAFILDGLYRSKAINTEPHVREVIHPRGLLHCEECWRPAGASGHWRAHYRYAHDSNPDNVVEAQFRARSWLPEEVESQFTRAGLRICALWGDFDRRPFALDAQRMLIVAKPSKSTEPASE